MTIWLLGAEGLLGSCLMQSLAHKKWHLIGVSKSELDITDYARVESLLRKSKPDVIINACAYTAVDNAESDTVAADAVNHLAVRNLARIAQKLDALLIHFSTDYVFDGRQVQPYVESDGVHPLNVYGRTKRAGEVAIMEETAKYFIIRTSWLFGAGGHDFFSKMCGLLQSSNELNVVNDQVGGPTYVGDLARVVTEVLARHLDRRDPPRGIYHYAGYPYVSWYEYAAYIQAALHTQPQCVLQPIASSAYPRQAPRPLNSRLDSSRVQAKLGVPPSDWRAAVRALVALRGI